ncbi:unnamed protein product [Periconia digitata]|uniref:Small ribosomal subunit protein bS18m n=1 Tax=Periconia digitata TaxID=1303443 RepID=A0A9W4UFZ5_9PLEO|nr:unnamed protein product [Periconia digitata]
MLRALVTCGGGESLRASLKSYLGTVHLPSRTASHWGTTPNHPPPRLFRVCSIHRSSSSTTAMSLTRTFAQSLAPGHACAARHFSTAPKLQAGSADGILKTLAGASNNNQPRTFRQSNTGQVKRLERSANASLQSEEELAAAAQRTAYQKHMYRKWQPGDVYAPHDLSGAEQNKWRLGRSAPKTDAFEVLGINPINEYKNFTILSEYMTETGRVKHSKLTGLRPKSQRKIAKAIRRAVGLGLMPSVHRHPLVLKNTTPARFF